MADMDLFKKSEIKSKRLMLLMQPTMFDKLSATARKVGLSKNEYVCRVVKASIESLEEGDIENALK
jgi:predicted HicB family RNase H-like nuclease